MDLITDLKWRLELEKDCRKKQSDRILVNLIICFPNCASKDMDELVKMAEWLEDENFIEAKSYLDYLNKIHVRVQKLELRFPTTDASHVMGSPQVHYQGQSQISLPNQPQKGHQLLSHNVRAGAQSSASLPPALPSMTSLTHTSVPNVADPMINMQSGIAQNFVGSSVSQGLPSNSFSNTQWGMPGWDQLQLFSPQEQQQLMKQNILQPTQMSNAVGRSTNTQSEIAHAQDLFHQQQQQHQLMNPQFFSSSMNSNAQTGHNASMNSNAQTGQNAVDWKEEFYQKIQAMKYNFLPHLDVIYQKTLKEFQQLKGNVSVSNVPQCERQKLLDLLDLLEGHMQILNVSKDSIVPAMKGNLSNYEKQVMHVINSYWSREPVSAQQQIQQPGGHPLSTQSQPQPQPQQPQQQKQKRQKQQQPKQKQPKQKPKQQQQVNNQQQQQQQQQQQEEVDNQPDATHVIADSE